MREIFEPASDQEVPPGTVSRGERPENRRRQASCCCYSQGGRTGVGIDCRNSSTTRRFGRRRKSLLRSLPKSCPMVLVPCRMRQPPLVVAWTPGQSHYPPRGSPRGPFLRSGRIAALTLPRYPPSLRRTQPRNSLLDRDPSRKPAPLKSPPARPATTPCLRFVRKCRQRPIGHHAGPLDPARAG